MKYFPLLVVVMVKAVILMYVFVLIIYVWPHHQTGQQLKEFLVRDIFVLLVEELLYASMDIDVV